MALARIASGFPNIMTSEGRSRLPKAQGRSASASIAHEVIDTYSLPEDEALAKARSITARTYDLVLDEGTSGFRFRSDVWSVANLIVATHTSSESHTLARTTRHLITNPGLYLKVQIFRMDGGTLQVDGTTLAMITNAVHLIDQSRPYVQRVMEGTHATIFIPHDLVGYDPDGRKQYLSAKLDSQIGRSAARTMRGAIEDLPNLSETEAPIFEAEIVAMVRSMLATTQAFPVPHFSQSDRLGRAVRYIEDNLSDPGLTVESISSAIGSSRATLFRAFDGMGGVETYIRASRLQRAFRLLAKQPPRRGAIGEVGAACGFLSAAEFSSSFRLAFGCKPSEVLGRWTADQASLLDQADAREPQDFGQASFHL